MAAPLTPAEMHAFTEFLGMVPMIVIGFIVLVVILRKTAPRKRHDDDRADDYQRYLRGERDVYTDLYEPD